MEMEKLKPDIEKKWVVFREANVDPKDPDEVAFEISYSSSKTFRDKFNKLLFKARQKRTRNDLPAALQTELQIEAMIGTVLFGWRGWTDRKSTRLNSSHRC